jgi:hypothetical protein
MIFRSVKVRHQHPVVLLPRHRVRRALHDADQPERAAVDLDLLARRVAEREQGFIDILSDDDYRDAAVVLPLGEKAAEHHLGIAAGGVAGVGPADFHSGEVIRLVPDALEALDREKIGRDRLDRRAALLDGAGIFERQRFALPLLARHAAEPDAGLPLRGDDRLGAEALDDVGDG